MPLDWNLYAKLDGVDTVVECAWLSHTWINLAGHYPKKVRAALDTTIRSAEDAIKTEKAARQQLHAISAHKRLSALVVNMSAQELHNFLAWITLQEPTDLAVRLVRYTKDDASDAAVITEVTFRNSLPIGQRFYGADTIFDFKLGRGADWEEME